MAQDINKVVVSSEMSDKDYFFVSTGGKLRRIPRSVIEALFVPGGNVTDIVDVASESELDAALNNILADMENLTERHVIFQGMNSDIFYGSYVLCRIYKRENSHACATFECYSYYGYTKWVKNLYDGTWDPLEWDNPPMLHGVTYRTTRRHNGKAVYAKRIRFVCQSETVVYFDPEIGSNYKYFVEIVGEVYNDTLAYWFQIPSKYVFVAYSPENGFRLESNGVDMRNHVADVTIYFAK